MATLLNRIYDKQLSVYSGYLVYFDDICMNKYITSYQSSIGVSNGMGTATVTMLYTPSFASMQNIDTVNRTVENGISLRIFAENMFTRKYDMIFDGIIKQKVVHRSAGDATISFTAVDYLYWMQRIVAPIAIPHNTVISPGERLKWKAQSIDPATTATAELTRSGSLRGKKIQEFFDILKTKTFANSKTYSDPNTVANFDAAVDRVEIMGEINTDLVDDRVIDFVIDTNATFADTMYVTMNNVTSNLLLEFYQDRDGIIRLKPPFWNEGVLRSHVIDPLMIVDAQEQTNWLNFYTRVITTGGLEEWMDDNARVDLLTPVGVYVGNLSDKSKAKWADYTSEGTVGSSYGVVGSGNPGDWIYPLMSRHTEDPREGQRWFGAGRDNDTRAHAGIDLIQRAGTVVFSCTSGTIVEINENFYDNTDAVIVRCDNGYWINYGEIEPSEGLFEGMEINQGHILGSLKTHSDGTMLHIEVYKGVDENGDKIESSIFTNEGSSSYLYAEKKDYRRRKDLIDPTFIADLPMKNG